MHRTSSSGSEDHILGGEGEGFAPGDNGSNNRYWIIVQVADLAADIHALPITIVAIEVAEPAAPPVRFAVALSPVADSQTPAATTNRVNKPNLRQAVRAMIIDPSDRFLLTSVAVGNWRGWVLPGGGIESGEDHDTALRRELAEEVGVPKVFVGPMVCRRTFYSTDMGPYDGQVNFIYLIPSQLFEVNPSMTDAELRAEGVLGSEWWTVAELEATSEELRPQSLPELAKLVLEHGAPNEPVVIESPA